MEQEFNYTCKQHDDKIREIEHKLELIASDIRGNGRKGIRTEIELIKKDLTDMPELKKNVQSLQKQMWIGIGGLLVLQPFLSDLIRHLFDK